MNKPLKIFLNIALLLILGFSLFKFFSKFYDYEKANKTYENIKKIYNNISENESKENIYSKMLELNQDYKFWLNVENTNINYPVVQGDSNSAYLKKDFNSETSSSGSIFLDYRNDSNYDFNTLIYGHNMKNKNMFNNLEKYKSEEFFNQNNKITLTDENYIYTYEVFSVYIADGTKDADIHYMINASIDNSEIDSYIATAKERSLYKKDLSLSSNDKILSLVTCSYEKNDVRTIVHAKLMNVENI